MENANNCLTRTGGQQDYAVVAVVSDESDELEYHDHHSVGRIVGVRHGDRKKRAKSFVGT